MHTISLHNWEVYLFYFILCQIYDMDILNWIWFFCTSPHIFSNISLYIHSRCLVKHKDCKYFHKYHKKWSCRLKSTSCMYAYEILLWISADYNVLWKNLKIYNFCYEISKWFEYKVYLEFSNFLTISSENSQNIFRIMHDIFNASHSRNEIGKCHLWNQRLCDFWWNWKYDEPKMNDKKPSHSVKPIYEISLKNSQPFLKITMNFS